MHPDKAPNFKDKAVLFYLANSEYDTTIHNPTFELQNGKLFVTGRIVEGSSQNGWLSGLAVSLMWDQIQGYVIFESDEDYISRLALAFKKGKLQ